MLCRENFATYSVGAFPSLSLLAYYKFTKIFLQNSTFFSVDDALWSKLALLPNIACANLKFSISAYESGLHYKVPISYLLSYFNELYGEAYKK